MDPKELEDRMEPDHLTSSDAAETLQAEFVEQTAEAAGKESPKKDDPKLRREYLFKFEWTDDRGKLWVGEFVNKILDIRKMQLAGVQRARFAMGMPVEAMDDAVLGLNLMVAHMMFSLTGKPAWAEDLLALDDVNLIQAIFAEVSAHEDTFRGGKPTEESSGKES